MTTVRLIAGGTALRCQVDGPDGAPWLTLGHSLATDLHLWDPQVEMLAERFRVLRYDMRGHGESGAPDGPYDWPMLVGDVVAIWDAMDVARSHFVGLSMGGMTGLGLALEHPGRLASLTCCDCRADAPAFFVDMWTGRQARVRAGGMAAVLDETLATWLTESTRAAGGAPVDEVAAMILATPEAGYLGATEALKHLDYKRSLGLVDVPTRFLVGADDGPHPEEMRAMSEAVAGSRCVVIPDAGHLSNRDQPERFGQALTEFLQGVL